MAATIALAVLASATLVASARAEEPAKGLNVADISRWPLERVTRRDGRAFAGLIRHEDDRQIELVEVGQRPGQPMFLLVRPIQAADVVKIERLAPAERQQLAKRIDAFRNRTAIMAALADDVRFAPSDQVHQRLLKYDGPWFSLESTAAESMTREAVVRIEQTFAGFRTVLRPRREPPRRLKILLLGSAAEYDDHLSAAGLMIRNPAYFDPQRNLIVAGGELASLGRRLAEARAHHQELVERQRQVDARLPELLRALSDELKQNGASDEKRRQVIAGARREWQQKRQSLDREIRRAESENAALYYGQFARLYHEAFHAYLDNYVFDPRLYDVPRWLNEGWAEIFEAGRLEGGALRLDAPRTDLLAALGEDVQGPEPMHLRDVLSAEPAAFVVGHHDTPQNATKLYRYCWGLAYDVTLRRQLLETSAMEQYLRRGVKANGPVERFEQLVGMPLEKYEAEWRRTILSLRSTP